MSHIQAKGRQLISASSGQKKYKKVSDINKLHISPVGDMELRLKNIRADSLQLS